jgi:hypothetical protein
MLDIATDQYRFPFCVFNQSSGYSRDVVFLEIGNQDIRAFPGKGDCYRATDAAVAARDNGAFPRKPARTFVGRLSMIRPRIHVCGVTRHRLLLSRIRRPGIGGLQHHCSPIAQNGEILAQHIVP